MFFPIFFYICSAKKTSMVLEQLFELRWIKKKEHSFFLGFIYAILGLGSSILIFPNNIGLMSVAFTSILIVPSLTVLLSLEETIEIKEKKLSIIRLFRNHFDIFKIYLNLFMGIFLAYLLVSILFPAAAQTGFAGQFAAANIQGNAFQVSSLLSLLANNLVVFITCFALSFVYGAGSIIFLTWNASVWGVVLGYFAVTSAGGQSPNFLKSLLPYLPHLITEALAYVSASIVGGVISKAIIREKLFSKKFYNIVRDALVLLGIGASLVFIAAVIESSLL
jgi:uncharacterized membrane protein SpoIIM required for sporulation